MCIDFETNGFPPQGPASYTELPLPFSNIPIQVSVDAVDSAGVVEHMYDSVIRGATQLCPWVLANVPVPMSAAVEGRSLSANVEDIAGLLREDDVIVAPQRSLRRGPCSRQSFPENEHRYAGSASNPVKLEVLHHEMCVLAERLWTVAQA